MKDPHRQVRLRNGKVTLVANLPDHPKLRPGNLVTLKDHPENDIKWVIEWVAKVPVDKSQLNRTWNNNI